MRREGVLETRRAICEAALRLFVERGIGSTSIEDILSASQISVGSFYYLFKNKNDLAVTLYLEVQEKFSLQLIEELHRYDQARDGIKGLVRFFLNWAGEHTTETSYLVWFREREILQIPPQAREQGCTQQLLAWLQVHIDRGDLRQLVPAQALALWFGPANGLVQQALGAFGMLYTPSRDPLLALLAESRESFAEAAWQALKHQEMLA